MGVPALSGAPLISPGNSVPVGSCGIDPTSGLVYALGCANYTQISTIGTTTVKVGPGGLFTGFCAISTGTAVMTAAAYDISGTSTFQLSAAVAPSSLGPFGTAAPGGIGVRVTGSLVVITTGTAGSYNVLWD